MKSNLLSKDELRETSIEKQLLYYSKKNGTKLVLAFDHSPDLKGEDVRIAYSSSDFLANRVSSSLKKEGYSTLVRKDVKLNHLENLLKQESNSEPHILDIHLASSMMLKNETRRNFCIQLVSALAHPDVVGYAAKEGRTIPNDLNLVAGNLVGLSVPEVKVLRL